MSRKRLATYSGKQGFYKRKSLSARTSGDFVSYSGVGLFLLRGRTKIAKTIRQNLSILCFPGIALLSPRNNFFLLRNGLFFDGVIPDRMAVFIFFVSPGNLVPIDQNYITVPEYCFAKFSP
jgi:hypothetical protein